MKQIKRLLIATIIIVMFCACCAMDTYKLTVYATNDTIHGNDIHGNDITLTICKAEDGRKILLEDAISGKYYTVIIDTCSTWNTEDDQILRVKERK